MLHTWVADAWLGGGRELKVTAVLWVCNEEVCWFVRRLEETRGNVVLNLIFFDESPVPLCLNRVAVRPLGSKKETEVGVLNQESPQEFGLPHQTQHKGKRPSFLARCPRQPVRHLIYHFGEIPQQPLYGLKFSTNIHGLQATNTDRFDLFPLSSKPTSRFKLILSSIFTEKFGTNLPPTLVITDPVL